MKRNKRIYQADSLFNLFLSCCCLLLCLSLLRISINLLFVLEASIDFCYHHSSKVSEVFSPERNFTCEVAKTDRIEGLNGVNR